MKMTILSECDSNVIYLRIAKSTSVMIGILI